MTPTTEKCDAIHTSALLHDLLVVFRDSDAALLLQALQMLSGSEISSFGKSIVGIHVDQLSTQCEHASCHPLHSVHTRPPSQTCTHLSLAMMLSAAIVPV